MKKNKKLTMLLKNSLCFPEGDDYVEQETNELSLR
jgi:hypothetical protein